jgi:hypothetical protein
MCWKLYLFPSTGERGRPTLLHQSLAQFQIHSKHTYRFQNTVFYSLPCSIAFRTSDNGQSPKTQRFLLQGCNTDIMKWQNLLLMSLTTSRSAIQFLLPGTQWIICRQAGGSWVQLFRLSVMT